MTRKSLVPYAYAETACDTKSWNTFLYWHKLSSIHRNGVFYNYSCRKIAEVLGISHDTTARHIKKMVSFGWVQMQHCEKRKRINLRILSVHKSEHLLIAIPRYKDKAIHIKALKAIILIRKINHQKFRINQKSKIVNHGNIPQYRVTRKEMRFIRKNGGLKHIEKTLKPTIDISNRQIGLLLKCSKRSASDLQVWMEKERLIKRTFSYSRLFNFDTYNSFNCFWNGKGYYMKRNPNSFESLLIPKVNPKGTLEKNLTA